MTGDLITIPCPHCSEQISQSALACKHCGKLVHEIAGNPQQTLVMDKPSNPLPFEDELSLGRTSRFESGSIVHVSVERVNAPISRYITEEPIILGRHDTAPLNTNHDIDLNPYHGRERGVSRHHAQIFTKDGVLYIEDLGSSNGTSLNGDSLEPNQPAVLHDGDELMLGRMLVWINFD